jgi:hypothetical protein
MRAVCKVRGFTLLPRVETLWRCGDGLFFEVSPLASDALLTTLHPLLENVLQAVCRKLFSEVATGTSIVKGKKFVPVFNYVPHHEDVSTA